MTPLAAKCLRHSSSRARGQCVNIFFTKGRPPRERVACYCLIKTAHCTSSAFKFWQSFGWFRFRVCHRKLVYCSDPLGLAKIAQKCVEMFVRKRTTVRDVLMELRRAGGAAGAVARGAQR